MKKRIIEQRILKVYDTKIKLSVKEITDKPYNYFLFEVDDGDFCLGEDFETSSAALCAMFSEVCELLAAHLPKGVRLK